MINLQMLIFFSGLANQSFTPPVTTSSKCNMTSSFTTGTREYPPESKASCFPVLSHTFNSPQVSHVRQPNSNLPSSKPSFPNNNISQPFISSPFSLSQTLPPKHPHPQFPAMSLPQQRFQQADVIQGSSHLMFPSHYQDGRGTLRFRYLNLLARLFPQFSDIFINSVLEDTNCDLLAAAEWLVQLEDRRSFMYPAFETFGTIPFSNQFCDNSDQIHQKTNYTENQDVKPSIKLSPSNSQIYTKFGRDGNNACNKNVGIDMQQNQVRLPCSPQVCVGASPAHGNCLYVQSQANQCNKGNNMNRMPNILPNSQVCSVYLKIHELCSQIEDFWAII